MNYFIDINGDLMSNNSGDPSSSKIQSKFFGQYLVEKGIVSSVQLDEAINLQQDNNSLLGTMALNKGYLSKESMEIILAEQKKINRKFGDLAYERGLLTREQVEELIEEQSKNHCFIGEALLRLGYMQAAPLHEHLENFRKLEKSRENELLSSIDAISKSTQVHTAVDLTRDLFYRLGYMIKATEVRFSVPTDMNGECFLATQKKKLGVIDYFGLLLSPELKNLLAQGNLCNPQTNVQRHDQLDTVAELIFNLNYMLCNELKEQGIKIKPGQVLNRSFNSLPEHSQVIAVIFYTVTDYFCLLYCVQ
jgi:hypothetical protein